MAQVQPVNDIVCNINGVPMTRTNAIEFIHSFDDNNNHETFSIGDNVFGYDDMGRQVVMHCFGIKEFETVVFDFSDNDI